MNACTTEIRKCHSCLREIGGHGSPSPVCVDCALDVLPRRLAEAVLADPRGPSAWIDLHGALDAVIDRFWEAAAFYLQKDCSDEEEMEPSTN